ncbi:phage protease [Algihabitans albus]|uniref:phage protease n=1 Tax=Algihabitans albus TaxID=2164067 RepID=UPI000E5C9199|nr:phage protease [Algihabitans albus]
MTTGQTSLLALCALPLPGGAAPEWVQLMPSADADGALLARDGRSWKLSDPAKVVEASLAEGRDLPFDYEHQTDHAAKNGQPAPAAGWIKALEARPDGIYARVEWTERARQHIESREYRYLSPTFVFDKTSREVKLILRAALTNDPALEVRALARREADPPHDLETTMTEEDLKALCSALGLQADAGPAAIVKAAEDQAAALKTAAKGGDAGTAALASLAPLVQLEAEAEPEAIATAVTARLKETGKSVPMEQYAALASRLEKLEDTETAARVDSALREGRIVPASREWALDYAKSDPKGFEAFLALQPVIVKPGAETTGQPARTKGAALDEAQLALCSQLGLKPEAFKETLDAEVKETA